MQPHLERIRCALFSSFHFHRRGRHAWLLGLLLGGCSASSWTPGLDHGKTSDPAAEVAHDAPDSLDRVARQVGAQAPLPINAFVAPTAWRSNKQGEPAIEPPDLSQHTWRAFMARTRPLQKKTPLWQPLPATRVVHLQMPPGSSFRCLVNPVEVVAETNDFETELRGWTLTRHVVCSSDGFRSWTLHPHRVYLAQDGTREVTLSAEGFLRERAGATEPHELHLIVRSDAEQRAARTGPPQILPAVAVNDE